MFINYVHTEPNSHFFDDLEQLRSTLAYMLPNEIAVNQARIGVENTIKQGYRLTKEPLAKHKIGDKVNYNTPGLSKCRGKIASITHTEFGIHYSILREDAVLDERVREGWFIV